MRWKISHRGHDPRQIDLLAVIALADPHRLRLAAILRTTAATPSSTTAFVEPSQSVRW